MLDSTAKQEVMVKAHVDRTSGNKPFPYASTDGVPHLTYYRKDHHLSFVWTGEAGPYTPVEVSYGGYGERVLWTIDTEVLGGVLSLTIQQMIQGFGEVCDWWVATTYETVVAK